LGGAHFLPRPPAPYTWTSSSVLRSRIAQFPFLCC
jgi:hypothetical protein